MKIGDLVQYCPDMREFKAYDIDDRAIGGIVGLGENPGPRGPLSWVKILWSGHAYHDDVLVEDLEVINEAR